MKATIEVPDELYRLVKAKSALEGRAVREVTVELYQCYVGQEESPAEDVGEVAAAGVRSKDKRSHPGLGPLGRPLVP